RSRLPSAPEPPQSVFVTSSCELIRREAACDGIDQKWRTDAGSLKTGRLFTRRGGQIDLVDGFGLALEDDRGLGAATDRHGTYLACRLLSPQRSQTRHAHDLNVALADQQRPSAIDAGRPES